MAGENTKISKPKELKRSVEELLVKSTSMTKTEVSFLYKTQLPMGGTVQTYMNKKDFKTTEEIVRALSEALGLDFMNEIPLNDIPAELLQKLPIHFSKAHKILPFHRDNLQIKVLVTNPVQQKVLDDLRILYGKKITPVLTTKQLIEDFINQAYERSTASLEGLEEVEGEEYDLDDPVIDLLEAGEDDAPVIKLVNSLLFRAVKEKASDIHIEPYEKYIVVRFRVDGVLFDIFRPPKKLQNAISSRIKIMANLNIAEKRLPQDGRIPLKLAGKDIDVRLSTVPTAFGERIVMRLQDRSNVILDLNRLGFSKDSLTKIDRVLASTYGIMLVTGPTGSGKSTTLYSALSKINTIDRNIITVEDPVEQRIPGIGQIQVNSKIGLTFASGLRAILRQDPNVVMIGEIRDLETAEIAINASLTGHLVLSTIHTNDSAGAFPRLLDMGCEPFLIATSLLGIVAQRLVRRLCENCKEPHTPTDFELQSLELTRSQVNGHNIYKAKGCNNCNMKGYSGRTIIQEILMVSDEIRTLVMQRADSGTIKKKAISQGMIQFRDHGITKVLDGVTSIEEVLANTQADI